MTCKEKLMTEHPNLPGEAIKNVIDRECPSDYGYLDDPEPVWEDGCGCAGWSCDNCWNREIPEEPKAEEDEDEIIRAAVRDALTEATVATVPNPFESLFGKPTPNEPTPFEFEVDGYQIKIDEEGKMTINPAPTEENNTPHILDSGNRREFESGAVRDIQEGKGRCDLLPLDVVGQLMIYCSGDDPKHKNAKAGWVLSSIAQFIVDGDIYNLYQALKDEEPFGTPYDMLLEVSKHFEEGCKKYGENNWQKGIPVHCYIDSAVRHYLKFLRGDKDEPHDRAFCWNILCAIWTCKHKPELNDYRKED